MNLDYALSRERRIDLRYRLRRRTQEVLKIIKKHSPSSQRIIDLGTAEGKMLQSIKQAFPSAFCLGIDYSFSLLLYGKSRFPDIHLICADVENLRLIKNDMFDTVVAAALIEHLVSPQKMLEESHRLLKNQGILILTTPNPIWEKMANALGLIKGEHYSVMSLQDLVDLCRKEKFLVLEHCGFMISPVGLWAEERTERILRKMGLDRYLLNQLVVAQKT